MIINIKFDNGMVFQTDSTKIAGHKARTVVDEQDVGDTVANGYLYGVEYNMIIHDSDALINWLRTGMTWEDVGAVCVTDPSNYAEWFKTAECEVDE